MDEMVTVSQRPFWEAIPRMEAMGPRFRAERTWIPSFTDALTPALTRLADTFARDAANIVTAETAVAVERYRLVHDKTVPERLEQLVPALLDAVPVDPFDGKPLRYRRDEAGYSVYSVNEDMKDDGGMEIKSKYKGSGPDLVFRVDHAPAAN
jgi:hypothetical protein